MRRCTIFFCSLIMLLCFSVGTQTGQSAQKVDDIDPCSLIAAGNVFAAFPILLKMEKKKTHQITGKIFLAKSLGGITSRKEINTIMRLFSHSNQI